jgi:uncharacterized protein (DUF2147 family)
MKRALIIVFAVAFAALNSSFTFSDGYANKILGTWLNENGKAKVKVVKRGKKFYGKIIWLREPNDKNGKAKLDKENPKKELQSKPIVGLEILKNFKYVGKKKWEDGTIYDPENGKTYSCYMEMKNDNLLKIRGYVGISLLGRTTMWTRVVKKKK